MQIAILPKNRGGFTLVEIVLAVAVLSLFSLAAFVTANQISQLSLRTDRKLAVAGELARQLRQAQALPMNTLLNGGDGYDFTPSGDSSIHTVGYEDFFKNCPVDSNSPSGTWWTRYDQRAISAAYGTPKVKVRWKWDYLDNGYSMRGYLITVEVSLPNSYGKGKDMVFIGKAFRTLENGVSYF